MANLGKIGIVYRDAYSASASYTKLDVVVDGGNAYIAIAASTGKAVTDTAYWKMILAGIELQTSGNKIQWRAHGGTWADLATLGEADRVTAEEGRVSAETSRAEAEQGRVSAETARVSAETARGSAEDSRGSAETGRADAEALRVSAEEARATAETARAGAETGRVANETARQAQLTAAVNAAEAAQDAAETAKTAAETAKTAAETAQGLAETAKTGADTAKTAAEAAKTAAAISATNAADNAGNAARSAAEADAISAAIAPAEQFRVTAEQGRVSGENNRSTTETSRVNAENSRVSAETGRSNAESARVTAETSRVTAEQGRVTAENARASAETGRSNAESARVDTEEARATAETARVSAETGRVANETARQAQLTAAVNAAEAAQDAATTKALEAYSFASAASGSATAAATSETNAAGSATAAAGSATDAAASAQAAAASANAAESGHPPVNIQPDTAGAASPLAGGTFTAIDSVTRDSLGHIEKVNTKTVTLPETIPTAQKGAPSGVAELDSAGKVPASQLPSYVDDVLEYSTLSNFPATGETGKIYVAIDTNIVFRWSGSAYVEISSSLALGETSSTAYRGDRGKAAYDHSQSAHAPADANNYTHPTYNAASAALIKVGRDASGHVVTGAAVAKSDITALGIPAQDTTYGAATTSAAGLMVAADKSKLNGVASDATKNTVLALTATITATWTGSAAPYSQVISVSDILETDTPTIDIVQTGTEATDSVMRKAWAKISRIITGAGSITVYAEAAIATSIPIQIRVVR